MFALFICSVAMARTVGAPERDDANYVFLKEHFGSVKHSMLTLFELMAAPDLPKYQEQDNLLWEHPGLLAFLCIFIIFGSFGMIALLTGVISESMFEKNELRREEAQNEKELRMARIAEGCDEIFSELDHEQDESGEVSVDVILGTLPKVAELFRDLNIEFTRQDLVDMANYMDTDHS